MNEIYELKYNAKEIDQRLENANIALENAEAAINKIGVLPEERETIVDYINEIAAEIPTKTSDLTNDSGFKTTDDNQTIKAGSVTFGVNDEIELVAGTNVSISGDAAKKQITISSTDANTESTLTITDKPNADTNESVYAITNLIEGGISGHAITPTYTELPTKAYVDSVVNALKTETWMFTLEDGSTVTKAVYVR